MFNAIKEFFFGKAQPVQPEAPYKVEAPAFKPTADAAPVESVAVAPAVKKSTAPRAKKPTAAKKPAAKKPNPTPTP
jgi:hypothetical protein